MKTALLTGLIVGGIYLTSYADSDDMAGLSKGKCDCQPCKCEQRDCGAKKQCYNWSSGTSSDILIAQSSSDSSGSKVYSKKDLNVKIVDLKEVEKIVAKKNALIFDARTGEWDDGSRIPGAKSLSAENSKDEILSAIPDKNQHVLVYCNSKQCPASRKLAEKLISLGYTNVMEYSDGIKGWKEAGKEIEKVK